ncbi:hypothetical protein GC897_13195 [Salmonella enterica]|nr:hypothetical protein [Salmonella enterica]MBW6956337.1 hypothetical protein [Salmonella enterica subsp. enterica serovar Weltevreden]MDJ4468527.1 hypothetical protein [Salmonella enterica]HCZ9309241.1 hypothetical protein [Citrobacter amalonaticus]
MADGISEWMPVIQTLTGGGIAGGVAILVSWMNHCYARERESIAAAERQRQEQQLAKDKRQKELFYIATELVFMLEQFAEGCARVATDTGKRDEQGFMRTTENTPEIDFDVITGDWRSLGQELMYAIRELPVLKEWSDREIAGMEESEGPPDYIRTSWERQYLYARLGLKAILQARRLRKLASLPDTRLDATKWSAQPVLWKVWRLERKRRSVQARLRLQTIAQMNVALKQSIKSNSQPGGSQ